MHHATIHPPAPNDYPTLKRLATMALGEHNDEAERMVRDAEQSCRDAGYRALMVMVYDDTGQSLATAWYRQQGFTFGLPGTPWCVLPYTDSQNEVEYDDIKPGQIIGFKPLHPGVRIEPAHLRTAAALGLRRATLPTIAGLLDD